MLALAEDIDAGGVLADLLAGRAGRADESAIALRLLGALHRLVLSGAVPDLSLHYPSVGGDGRADLAIPGVRAAIGAHATELRASLDQPPQTNEVGRAAALLGALHHLVAHVDLPIRLHEIGTSAGLNLRADRFRVGISDGTWVGPAESPAVLPDAWDGRVAPVDQPLSIIDRVGCDLAPIDPTTETGRLTLMSYVWPDQVERLARLRGALAVAADVPARLVAQRAVDFVRGLAVQPGTWLVLWHSVMWQYLDDAERVAVLADLEDLGAYARVDAPLAHVTFEPTRTAHDTLIFTVGVRTWPDVGLGPGERILGVGPAHGLPVSWT